jgi:hypothetical protein
MMISHTKWLTKEEAKVFIGTPSGLILVKEENIKVNGLPIVIEKS